MLTRPERIRFLLEYYVDVVAGVRDRGTGGEHIPLMCACWNHPSYQELERLRGEMRTGAPALYKAVVAVYVYPRFVRRAVCPKCDVVAPPELVGELHRHRHGRKSAPFVARMVRVRLYPVVAGHVDAAIGWMDERWRGSVFVPDELLPLVEAAGQDERPRRMLHAPLMPAYDRTESELFASILINTLLVLAMLSLGAGIIVGIYASEDENSIGQATRDYSALAGGILAGVVAAFYCLLIATVLGLLRDISRAVRRRFTS